MCNFRNVWCTTFSSVALKERTQTKLQSKSVDLVGAAHDTRSIFKYLLISTTPLAARIYEIYDVASVAIINVCMNIFRASKIPKNKHLPLAFLVNTVLLVLYMIPILRTLHFPYIPSIHIPSIHIPTAPIRKLLHSLSSSHPHYRPNQMFYELVFAVSLI